MKAIVFNKSIPRYIALKLLGGRRAAGVATGRLSVLCPASLQDVAEPVLPTGRWLRVRPVLSGICGSDLSVMCSKGSPYLSPLTSTPFVLGHEVLGVVTEVGGDVVSYENETGLSPMNVGDRVLLEPALGCITRGISPSCPACERGQPALCINATEGDIAPGIQTGYCRDTGGGWSSGFVAHRSQLHAVPQGVPDQTAVLVEPLTCVMHGVLRASIKPNDTVLVIGCGSIGLLTVAAVRSRHADARIVAVAKYPHQERHALDLGADRVLRPAAGPRKTRYDDWAAELGVRLLYPEIGKPTVIGGVDVTLDCIASSGSIDDAVRFTGGGGKVVLVGMPGIPSNIDWTAIWYKELIVLAAYAYGVEEDAGGRQTWDLACDMLKTWSDRLAPLVGEPFALEDYRRAFASALFTGRSQSVKTVFRFSE